MSDAKYLGLTANKLAKIAYDLETKNAKMSELMVEMYGFVRDVCELHPYVLTNAYIPEWQITDHGTPAERYAEKMQELGIKVDDGDGI